tara:strand:+ start:269 stop:754 length:486 start_codon:yes stop_codon:yes gene_type:complete
MSVSFGSALTSANLNTNFVSKNADSTMAGVLDLNDSNSGTRITNAQQEINNLKNVTNTSITIDQGGTITLSTSQRVQYFRVSGNGGAKTLSTTPFGTSGGFIDGTIIRLVGTSDTNTLSIQNNDVDHGVIVNGNCTLAKYNILTLVYDSELSRFIEISRNF